MTLIITKSQIATINSHCQAAYPNEGCGALIGTLSHDALVVHDVVGLANVGQTRADWFEIDPMDIVMLERQARREKLSILGYFHSHPDSPCRPSIRDLERAWPVYVYVIVTVAAGAASDLAGWSLAPDGSQFENTPIQITEEPN